MLALLLLIAADPPLATPACPIDRAVYRLRADPRFTAGFERPPHPPTAASDLLFWLKTPRRTYRFVFHSPNGYGGTFIAPEPREPPHARDDRVLDPESIAADGDPPLIAFDAFHADLSVYPSPPQAADLAPARLFARGLGPELWYNPVALAAGGDSAEPESMPIGLFEPAGCST